MARALMTRLVASARMRGFARLVGAVLRANHAMLGFAGSIGFAIADDPEDADQVIATLELRAPTSLG